MVSIMELDKVKLVILDLRLSFNDCIEHLRYTDTFWSPKVNNLDPNVYKSIKFSFNFPFFFVYASVTCFHNLSLVCLGV